MRHENNIINWFYAVVSSFIAAVEIAFFRLACMQSYAGEPDPDGLAGNLFSMGTLLIIIVLTVTFTLLALLVMRRGDGFFKFCFKYRYLIAVTLLVILVVFQVSGTSIGMLTNMLGGEAGDYLGVLRNRRRDEWVVNTPLALSQVYSGYVPVSPLASGGGLNLTLVYAQPCWDFSTFFRPFLWGYLLLPSAYGLSFFWCARLILLFMVSFEFGRLITGDKRRLALVYAVFITFSPLVQWWFAVNSIAEILIFSQLFILLFKAFLSAGGLRPMLLFGLAIAYCAAAFVLGLYPAWQVLLVYVMASMCLVLLIGYIRAAKCKRDVALHAIVFIVAIAIAIIAVFIIVMNSLDTIKAVTSSEYPGSRLEVGGGLFDYLFTYPLALVAIVDPTPIFPNVCEKAGMFALFPLGVMLGFVVAFRKRDGFLIALLVVELLFLIFGIVGLPAPLAKALLLSNVTVQRLALGTGVIDIILLFRCIALMPTCIPAHNSSATRIILMVLISVVFGVITVFFACVSALPMMRMFFKLFSVLFITLSVFAVLHTCFFNNGRAEPLLCVAAVVMLAGLMVNPVQLGLSRFENTPLSVAIEQIEEEDGDACNELWVADDSIIAQACIAYGVSSLNSVALYPHLDIWKPIDPQGRYREVYNRYAHIKVKPTDDELNFELTVADGFTVYLDNASLKTLGVRYWVSEDDLTQYSDGMIRFELAKSAGPYNVYKLVY